MKSLSVLLYEWKHFVRSPFKVVALLLFVLAGGYGLHNGASLYHDQLAELAVIQENMEEERQKNIAYYDEGKSGPPDRPWVDLSTPFWSIWYSGIHHFKEPSPALVYGIGQAEQYGFYKRVSFRASPYDADMTQEIANPERLQTGTLDFSFSVLFLLPLLLLILLYNLRSAEAELGFLPLIEVQTASSGRWLVSRVAFYIGVVFVVLASLLVYGAMLTGIFAAEGKVFGQMLLYSTLYLLFWSVIYYFILWTGTSIMGNTLRMVGVWLLFAFIVPAIVHQWINIAKPANLMTDLIDATRDKAQELYDLPDSLYEAKLDALFPEIVDSPIAKDSTKRDAAYSRSSAALVNELVKESIGPIEADNEVKNKLIRASYWFNPIVFFQNRFNTISNTHYNDYQQYRDEIQSLVDKQNRILVLDTWNGTQVDKQRYLEYQETLKTN